MGIDDVTTDHVVCSAHFDADDFEFVKRGVLRIFFLNLLSLFECDIWLTFAIYESMLTGDLIMMTHYCAATDLAKKIACPVVPSAFPLNTRIPTHCMLHS